MKVNAAKIVLYAVGAAAFTFICDAAFPLAMMKFTTEFLRPYLLHYCLTSAVIAGGIAALIPDEPRKRSLAWTLALGVLIHTILFTYYAHYTDIADETLYDIATRGDAAEVLYRPTLLEDAGLALFMSSSTYCPLP
jgi:hypothetical protein